jgi:hypothetical protein
MKPEKKFTAGTIAATIWRNQTADGQEYHSISFSRRYKDKEGNWKDTSSLTKNDLPRAIVVLQEAYKYLTLKESQGDGSLKPKEEELKFVK